MNDQEYDEEGIFESAISIADSVKRSRYLDEACAGNERLRTSLERLIQCDDTSGNFLNTPAIAFSRASHDHQAGSVIGRYRLDKRIGEGGFGVVWEAQQLEPVNRAVALKIIKLGMDTQRVIDRFEAERQALARMNHPHIATVLDAGCTELGRPYFVMELVEGVAIDVYCDQKRLSIPSRLQLFTEICRAVQHAHQKGIVHRDLKPSNILVTEDEGQSIPKIIDFGIAKAVDVGGTDGTQPTIHGEPALDTRDRTADEAQASCQLIGTPMYMSPEQILGREDVDTRADVYALGNVLHKLLVGSTPLDPDWLAASRPEDWYEKIMQRESVVPSDKLAENENADEVARNRNTTVASLCRSMRGDLDWIVEKAMLTDRSQRYDSAAELALDVDRHLRGELVTAGSPTALYRIRKAAIRNRTMVVAGSMIFAALLLGAVGLAVGMVRAEDAAARATRYWRRAETEHENAVRERNVALQMRKQAEQEAEKAMRFAQVIEELIGAADPEHGYPADLTVRQQLDFYAASIGQQLSEYPLVEARLRRLVGRLYMSLREYEKSVPQLKRALELNRKVLQPSDSKLAMSQVNYANSLFYTGQIEEGEQLLVLALSKLSKADPSAELIEGLMVLSKIRSLQSDSDQSTGLLHETWKLSQQLNGDDHPKTLRYQALAARRQLAQGKHEAAERIVRDALQGILQVRSAEHLDVAFIYEQLAFVLWHRTQLQQAEEHASEAVRIYRKAMGGDNIYLLGGLVLLSKIAKHSGDIDEAIMLAREAGTIADRIRLGSRSLRRDTYELLTELLRDVAPLESVEAEGKAVQALLDCFPNRRRLLSRLLNQAFDLRCLNQWDEALEAYERVVRQLRSSGEWQPLLIQALHDQADLHREMGKPELAVPLLAEAVQLSDQIDSPQPSRIRSERVILEIDYLTSLYESGQLEVANERIEWLTSLASNSEDLFYLAASKATQAQSQMHASRHETAGELLQSVKTSFRGRAQPGRLICRINCMLADCDMHSMRFASCEARLQRALKLMQRSALRQIDRRQIMHQLVDLYKTWGSPEQAEQWLAALESIEAPETNLTKFE